MPIRISAVRQAVSEESLFRVLAEWCRSGAGRKNWALRILSAFVSGNGVRAISPLLDVFLADGNSLEIIFGVDRGGTDRDALRQLSQLRYAYPHQATVRLFYAPAAASIFHPKLYILDAGGVLRLIVGSSNLTLPGLSTNLESLLYCEGVRPQSGLGRAAMTIWNGFALPRSPLRPQFLRDLTKRLAAQHIRLLPSTHPEERQNRTTVRSVWKP